MEAVLKNLESLEKQLATVVMERDELPTQSAVLHSRVTYYRHRPLVQLLVLYIKGEPLNQAAATNTFRASQHSSTGTLVWRLTDIPNF